MIATYFGKQNETRLSNIFIFVQYVNFDGFDAYIKPSLLDMDTVRTPFLLAKSETK